MAEVMIGIDPHKSSPTAVAISAGEEPLGELQVDACPSQAQWLLAWAAAWPKRTWAVEGAAGLPPAQAGHPHRLPQQDRARLDARPRPSADTVIFLLRALFFLESAFGSGTDRTFDKPYSSRSKALFMRMNGLRSSRAKA